MVKEALGLGPDYYCVVSSTGRLFADRLYLLTRFLPVQKICCDGVYGIRAGAPFDRSVRARRVCDEINARSIPPAEMPLLCPACRSCLCDHAMEDLPDV